MNWNRLQWTPVLYDASRCESCSLMLTLSRIIALFTLAHAQSHKPPIPMGWILNLMLFVCALVSSRKSGPSTFTGFLYYHYHIEKNGHLYVYTMDGSWCLCATQKEMGCYSSIQNHRDIIWIRFRFGSEQIFVIDDAGIAHFDSVKLPFCLASHICQ